MRHAYRSVLYVGDGIFVERGIAERLAGTTTCWEFLTRGVLGHTAINLNNLDEEGNLESHQILLGFTFDLTRPTIALPEEKMDGARILFGHFFSLKHSQAIRLLEVQQLRGRLEHFHATNDVWGIAKGPTDALLGFADEIGLYIRCPNPTVWKVFRGSLSIVETQCTDEDTWRGLSQGQLIRLLKHEERLSFASERIRAIWISADAALSWLAGVS